LNETRNIIQQLENQRNAIDRAISALREIEGPTSSTKSGSSSAAGPAKRGRRGISAEGRARIGEATRRRWAAKRAAEAAAASPAQKPAKRKKRRLSPEGRERIAEATRRRWAAKRAADAAAQAPARKTVRKRRAARKTAGTSEA